MGSRRLNESTEDLSAPCSVLTLGPRLAVSVRTVEGGVYRSKSMAHKVMIGAHLGTRLGSEARPMLVLPSGSETVASARAGVPVFTSYLDPRRYRVEDAYRLAAAWQGFVPGLDDPCEAFADALKQPRRRLDGRVEKMLDLFEAEDLSVSEMARRIGLSESRATALARERLGAPPRSWRNWMRMRNAIGEMAVNGANCTRAAVTAGFADSAHFSRTSRATFGVAASQLAPSRLHLIMET